MKKFFSKQIALVLAVLMVLTLSLTACDMSTSERQKTDVEKQQEVAKDLEKSQPTPTDIEYSLERYNLIRRAYWVNGQREKARTVPCPVEKPLGYIVLMMEGVGIIGRYVVDGKVSSLNSFLTPDSEYYEQNYGSDGRSYGDGNSWLADVDGSYGTNDTGIFFFTPEGNYIEWTGTYLYSDIPFVVEDPVLKVEGGN